LVPVKNLRKWNIPKIVPPRKFAVNNVKSQGVLSIPLHTNYLSINLSLSKTRRNGRKLIRLQGSSLEFFHRMNPSSRFMALGFTQPLTEMSTRNIPGGKGRPAHNANVTIICELIV
jgi:hypothetical protein